MGTDDDYDQILSGLADALALPEGRTVPELRSVPPLPFRMPANVDVATIRRKAGLSQPAFASLIGVPVATLRNWEQGHRSPTGPAQVLLALLDRDPRIVEKTLAD
jgi:putative transcriptional regulator